MSANIVMFGTPRTGSSIAASMLQALGWNLFPDANWSGESAEMIEIQQAMVDRAAGRFVPERFDVDAARELMAQATSPWLIKDLTLSFTMDLWMPLFHEFSNGLPVFGFMLTRNPEEVDMSWRRRTNLKGAGCIITPDRQVASWKENITLSAWTDQAERAFMEWEGPKLQIDFADLKQAGNRFNPRNIKSRVPVGGELQTVH